MIKIVQIGIGPLGRLIGQHIWDRPDMTAVAAVDPALAGEDLGELCSREPSGITVSPTLKQALSTADADVAVLATVSDLTRIASQIEEILGFGLPVVSTCEELTFPWQTEPKLASRIDRLARGRKVAVVATGVNPGFLMDTLPVVLSAVCRRLDKVRVSRIQDASSRRLPFQRKIGAGLSAAEFEEKKSSGSLRHVGLTESMHMMASCFGWKLDRTEELITPVVAKDRIVIPSMSIEAGMAAGVQQIARGFEGSEERIVLTFRASVNEPSAEDTVELVGVPHLVSTIRGGVHGDLATCSITLNAIGRLLAAQPGLRSMVDLPPVSYFRR